MLMEPAACKDCGVLFEKPYMTSYKKCLECMEKAAKEQSADFVDRLLAQVFPEGLEGGKWNG